VRVILQEREKRSETSPIRRIWMVSPYAPTRMTRGAGTYVLDSAGWVESEVLDVSYLRDRSKEP
jgi:hypothetical protein